MALFWGEYEKRIDKKGRVSVPSEFRTALAQSGSQELIVLPEPKQPWVRGMPRHAFEQVLAQLQRQHGRFTAQRTRASRFVFGRARPLSFDPEGRISLPKAFLEHAGITDALVFVGGGDHIQIWQPDRLNESYDSDAAEAEDVLEGLEELEPEGASL
ncbi:MAG: division/cell wall cluster transcriptional repressor MraZ [Rhodothalassiaceae bacterium]